MADYSDVFSRISQLRVIDLKEALKTCHGLRSGNKPVLVKRCEEMLAHPRLADTMATKLREMLTSGGGFANRSALATPSLNRVTMQPLTFSNSPFLKSVIEVSAVTRLSQGTIRSIGGPSRVLRFKLSESQHSQLNRARLFIRSGEITASNKCADKYPRMIRWYMNGKLIKEATHTRFGCIDVTEHLSHFGAQEIVIELIQPSKATPVEASTYDNFATQLIIAETVKAEELLPIVTQRTPSEKECFEKVLAYLKKDQEDADGLDDISFGLMVVPLHCPVSQLRMSYPARGVECNHLHCFDALFYLKMNARKTAWLCPICNRHTPLESLRIDSWLKKVILDSHPEAVEIELNNDGTWKSKALDDPDKEESRKRPRRMEKEETTTADKPRLRTGASATDSLYRGAPSADMFDSFFQGFSTQWRGELQALNHGDGTLPNTNTNTNSSAATSTSSSGLRLNMPPFDQRYSLPHSHSHQTLHGGLRPPSQHQLQLPLSHSHQHHQLQQQPHDLTYPPHDMHGAHHQPHNIGMSDHLVSGGTYDQHEFEDFSARADPFGDSSLLNNMTLPDIPNSSNPALNGVATSNNGFTMPYFGMGNEAEPICLFDSGDDDL
eukprot:m.172729 g.172729  ORF g.172729 m.172729 type:complete len:608 (-) comp31698_c7_seq3:334-2157(-)